MYFKNHKLSYLFGKRNKPEDLSLNSSTVAAFNPGIDSELLNGQYALCHKSIYFLKFRVII
jgi:hypothetical protein